MKTVTKHALLLFFVLLSCVVLLTACGHTHEFGEWSVSKQATCSENGERVRYCTCGEAQTEQIYATGHSFGSWVTIANKTCTENGEEERICDCGEKQTKTVPASHDFGDWTTTKEASYTEEGSKERSCFCGEKEVESIPKLQKMFDVSDLTVNLTAENNYTQSIDVTVRYKGISVYWKTYDSSIATCAWSKEWNNSVTQLTITGKENGTVIVYVYLSEDGDLDAATEKFAITVNVKYHDGSAGLAFTKEGNGYAVSLGKCTEANIVIPSTYKGLPVIKIKDSGFYLSNGDTTFIKSVVIPDSVTKIGDDAFRGCTGLTNIIIPEGVTTIGNRAFRECAGLTNIIFPEGVTTIGERAFYECRNLSTVILSDSVQFIGEYAFWKCVRLTNLYLGSGLTDICDAAFSSCNSLNHAFYNGTTSSWKKVINEGLYCDVFPGEQPVGDIVNVDDMMTKALVFTGKYNNTMYLSAQFYDIQHREEISEYRFVIEVYDTQGKLTYLYTYTFGDNNEERLSKLFALPYCTTAQGYEVVIAQIAVRYKDGSIERAFTDYSKTISTGTSLTNVNTSHIVNPDNV